MSPRRNRFRRDQHAQRNHAKRPAHPDAPTPDVRFQDLTRGHEPSSVKIFKWLIIAVPILLLIVIFIRPPPPPPSQTYTEIGGSVPLLIDKPHPRPAHIPARLPRSIIIPNETQLEASSPCADTKFVEWVEWPGTADADRDRRCQSESECQFPGIDGDDCGTSVCLFESVAAIPALLLFIRSIDGEGDEQKDLLCIKGPEVERLASRLLKVSTEANKEPELLTHLAPPTPRRAYISRLKDHLLLDSVSNLLRKM